MVSTTVGFTPTIPLGGSTVYLRYVGLSELTADRKYIYCESEEVYVTLKLRISCVFYYRPTRHLAETWPFFWTDRQEIIYQRETQKAYQVLTDGGSGDEAIAGTGRVPSCRPGDGRAVFLGLHPQRSYAGGLAIGINVEVVAVDAPADPGAPKQAAHVCLSHVAAAWTGDAQEVGDASGSVRVRRHAGRDGVARHHAAWHRGGCTAAPDP